MLLWLFISDAIGRNNLRLRLFSSISATGMNKTQWFALLHFRTNRQQVGEPDSMVNFIVRPRAPAAERHNGKANVAG